MTWQQEARDRVRSPETAEMTILPPEENRVSKLSTWMKR